jgi:hypothetical protein
VVIGAAALAGTVLGTLLAVAAVLAVDRWARRVRAGRIEWEGDGGE